jgi:hypothetical protein
VVCCLEWCCCNHALSQHPQWAEQAPVAAAAAAYRVCTMACFQGSQCLVTPTRCGTCCGRTTGGQQTKKSTWCSLMQTQVGNVTPRGSKKLVAGCVVSIYTDRGTACPTAYLRRVVCILCTSYLAWDSRKARPRSDRATHGRWHRLFDDCCSVCAHAYRGRARPSGDPCSLHTRCGKPAHTLVNEAEATVD